MIEVYENERAATDGELDELERRLGIKLPDDYRKWILKYNGGRPHPSTFKRKGVTGPYSDGVLAWFLAIYEGTINNFELKFKFMKITNRRLPESLAPVAVDPFGNLICISIKGSDYGAVYFWNHEEETDPPSMKNVSLIADNFDEFLKSLH